MPSIKYESAHFPSALGIQRAGSLAVTWDEIIWSALTIGRPNLHFVFAHSEASLYEALFRLSLTRMALEQRGAFDQKLYRTAAFQALDPTEKGAVSYFLGMTFCKVFAHALLNTPWLLHLDVFRDQLGAVLGGRSRPDLVGQANSGNWHAFECKGRSSEPNEEEKGKAKHQAQRLVRVDASPCALHIGSFAYFRNDVLQFYWRDPPADEESAIDLPYDPKLWRYYYEPFWRLFISTRASRDPAGAMRYVEGADVSISVHPEIEKALLKNDWQRAHAIARQSAATFVLEGYFVDGLKVTCGSTWSDPTPEGLIQ